MGGHILIQRGQQLHLDQNIPPHAILLPAHLMGLVIDHIGMSLHLGHEDDLADAIRHDVLIILRNVILTHPQTAHLFHVRYSLGDVDDF